MQGSLRYKSYKMRNGAPKHFLAPRQSVSSRPNTFSHHDKAFRPAQSLSHATTKCLALPKHFLAPRQSVSSCPNTFSRHDKVFRPAQSLSHATTKCLALPKHFL